jgi:cysteine desulfuration protein SufE
MNLTLEENKIKIYGMKEVAGFEGCLNKQAVLEELLKDCSTADEKYQKIIAMGRELLSFPDTQKHLGNIVPGCQSTMYLHAYLEDGKMRFLAHSEALISAGLAALLIQVYDGETPEVVLTCPPRFLETIGIQNSISPSRSNGLASLFLKMKQESLRFI